MCKSVNFHIGLRNIWRIRRFITTEACHHIVRGLVLSRFHYANSLLLACSRLTLLVYNACRTRLRGWSCLADATSPPLICLGSYIGSFTNSCCIFTKLYMIWLLVTFLPWYISRTLILLNMGNDCDPLQIRPGWLFPDHSNVPVTWALLSLLLASGMISLFIYVNCSPWLCSRGSWKLTCFHNFCSLFFILFLS